MMTAARSWSDRTWPALSPPAAGALERLDASALAVRAAIRLIAGLRIGQREQARERFGVGGDRVRVVERLELLGRGQQQLLDDQVRDLVDPRTRFGRQRRQLEVEPLELGAPD